MYIQNIKLQNYRNYENLNGEHGLDLGKSVTLLIGKNGAGKSNLINALKQSISFIFSKNAKISQKNFVANTTSTIKSFETNDATRKKGIDGIQEKEGSWPIRILTTIDIDSDSSLKVLFEKKDLSSGMKESYSDASIKFWERYRDLKDLPVIVNFSDSFPPKGQYIGKKIQDLLNSEFGISQSAGYYNWDDSRDCSTVWLQFFTQQWKNNLYGHSINNEKKYLDAIHDCMISFSKSLDNAEENFDFELKDITVVARGKNDKVILKFKNGMESDFETLPAGYRRAFSIAFDIANRAFLLNSNCNPDGVVLIDEIDLHLHPSLAQEILERLQITFPRIQFIVSTHSPLVLSNFKQDETDNSVYRLTRNENFGTSIQKINYSFGIDYNTLLTDLMGTKFRNSLLRQLIESYYYWKESEDEEMMNSIYTEIVGLVGNNSNILTHLK